MARSVFETIPKATDLLQLMALMVDSQKILCTMACLESLRNHQGYLYKTIGSIYKLYESMPEGKHRHQLLDEISKLDVIANGIKEAMDRMMEAHK